MARSAVLLVMLLLVIGCDTGERLNRLEKENADLKAAVEKDQAARDFDLQAKCAKDAKTWFSENFPPDKSTILLDYTDHYSKSINACFIEVEHHTNDNTFNPKANAWGNSISLWNVYENTQYGSFMESHFTDFKNPPHDEVIECTVTGQKCTSLDQFNSLASHYLSN